MTPEIKTFLNGSPFAVVGASTDRNKYGNKVLRCYQQNQLSVIPVNPKGGLIEGMEAYIDLQSVNQSIHGISIITPPAITESVVEDAAKLGINNIWIQPGAESEIAVRNATGRGANLIAGGHCILVVLGFRDE